MFDLLNSIQRAKWRCDPSGSIRVEMALLVRPNRKTRRAVTSRRWNKKMRKVISMALGKHIAELKLTLPNKEKVHCA